MSVTVVPACDAPNDAVGGRDPAAIVRATVVEAPFSPVARARSV